jgi:hypothetical protein
MHCMSDYESFSLTDWALSYVSPGLCILLVAVEMNEGCEGQMRVRVPSRMCNECRPAPILVHVDYACMSRRKLEFKLR